MNASSALASSGNTLTSLIFPMYNPGPDIERTWHEVKDFVRTAPGNWEVLLVCDGCTDGTNERLKSLVQKEDRWVRVLNLPKNRGKGNAVRVGLAEAHGQWRIFTDVDLSYGLDGVLRVARQLWSGTPVVVGSRLLPESSYVIPAWLQDYAYRRRIQSIVFSTMVRVLLSLRFTDTQGGLKGFSAAATEQILPYLQCEGFSFDCELLLVCVHLGFEVREVPVQFVFKDDTSTTNFRKTLTMVKDLLRIRKRFRVLPPAAPNSDSPAEQPRQAA
jgi:dolichyl-phosphate beta-glucosyltransferase